MTLQLVTGPTNASKAGVVGLAKALAVELARAQNVTLCAFARRGRVNVYTAPGRVV